MVPMKDKTTASMEDYLEAIIMLKEDGRESTVTAISELIGVKKPSVNWALKKLVDAGYVTHERYGDIDLTPEGAIVAREVYRRHKTLTSFLVDILRVHPEIAARDACKMEHVMSKETIKRLEKFIDFVLDCHPGQADWEDLFSRCIECDKDDRRICDRFTPKN
jgi:DtxR family Mn-dependent transcriptional regulator